MGSRKLPLLWSSLLLLIGCSELSAQTPLPSVVQLPSFSTFRYNGTVVVPDSGGAYLGGIKRFASSSTRRGRGLGHAVGGGLGGSGASAHATIIDLNEMDRQILGGTPEQFLRSERLQQAGAGKSKSAVDPDAEGKALVRYARRMYREGNQSRAFDGYLLAIDVLSPRLRDLAAAEFKRVFGPAAEQATRMQTLRR
jgi:hypothetical protein